MSEEQSSRIKRKRFRDQRGVFEEVLRLEQLARDFSFRIAQVNVSHSKAGVLRGLHMQRRPYGQRKLISVINGSILDFFVETDPSADSFGALGSVKLAADSDGILLGETVAHGFLALEPETIVLYAVDNLFSPDHEISYSALPYLDQITYDTGFTPEKVVLSKKDMEAPRLL